MTEGVPAAPAGAGVVLAVVALALAGTLAPFTLFAFGQSRVSAEVAGAFLNLEPLVGAIAGAVVFGDPVGLVQVAGGLAILAGIALSSLPLIAAGRMARRAAAVVAAEDVGAGTDAGAAVGAGCAGAGAGPAGAGRVGPGIGTGRAGAEFAWRTKPPSPESAVAEARVNEWPSLPHRCGRDAHPLNSGERHGGRNGVFVGVRGGKFAAERLGDGWPGLARAGRAPGGNRGPGPARTRPGGRVAGRPPARGRGPGRGPRTDEPGRRARRRVLLQVGA